MENLIPVCSLLLIAAIIWMWRNPPKGVMAKRAEQQKQLKRKQDHKAKMDQGRVSPTVLVTSITTQRDLTSYHITRDIKTIVTFPGIEKGYFSETVYLVVDGEGSITQWSQERTAQDNFKKGDYGIVAVTMSKGVITTRDIKPDIIHEDNMFRLYLGMVLNTK